MTKKGKRTKKMIPLMEHEQVWRLRSSRGVQEASSLEKEGGREREREEEGQAAEVTSLR